MSQTGVSSGSGDYCENDSAVADASLEEDSDVTEEGYSHPLGVTD
jgi:hypothetical protein